MQYINKYTPERGLRRGQWLHHIGGLSLEVTHDYDSIATEVAVVPDSHETDSTGPRQHV